eukprot:s1083_g9.t1
MSAMKRPAAAKRRTSFDDNTLGEIDVRTLRKWIQDVEPEFASAETIGSLDKSCKGRVCTQRKTVEEDLLVCCGDLQGRFQNVDELDLSKQMEFPKSGYEKTIKGSKLIISNPALMSAYNFELPIESDEDWDIFLSRDGDTLWNNKDESEPKYLQQILSEQYTALESDEESIGSDESVPNMTKVDLAERVVIWYDAENDASYLVRPYDGIGMVLEFNDPVLHVVERPDGSWKVIVASVSQEDNIKARWSQKILASQHAEKVEQKGLQWCAK